MRRAPSHLIGRAGRGRRRQCGRRPRPVGRSTAGAALERLKRQLARAPRPRRPGGAEHRRRRHARSRRRTVDGVGSRPRDARLRRAAAISSAATKSTTSAARANQRSLPSDRAGVDVEIEEVGIDVEQLLRLRARPVGARPRIGRIRRRSSESAPQPIASSVRAARPSIDPVAAVQRRDRARAGRARVRKLRRCAEAGVLVVESCRRRSSRQRSIDATPGRHPQSRLASSATEAPRRRRRGACPTALQRAPARRAAGLAARTCRRRGRRRPALRNAVVGSPPRS